MSVTGATTARCRNTTNAMPPPMTMITATMSTNRSRVLVPRMDAAVESRSSSMAASIDATALRTSSNRRIAVSLTTSSTTPASPRRTAAIVGSATSARQVWVRLESRFSSDRRCGVAAEVSAMLATCVRSVASPSTYGSSSGSDPLSTNARTAASCCTSAASRSLEARRIGPTTPRRLSTWPRLAIAVVTAPTARNVSTVASSRHSAVTRRRSVHCGFMSPSG